MVISATSASTLQKDLTVKWNEHAHTGFPNYVSVHGEGVETEAEGRLVVKSLQSFCDRAVNEMVGTEQEDVEGRRFCQRKMKNSAERSHDQRMFSKD